MKKIEIDYSKKKIILSPNKLLVKHVKLEKKQGSLFIPDSAKDVSDVMFGTIEGIHVPENSEHEIDKTMLKYVPEQIAKSKDIIVGFFKFAGKPVVLDDDYLIIDKYDVLFIIE